MTKKSLKQRGEDAAAAYLERVSICVVERSWRTDTGVIDIIAFEGDTLVIIDVKTRRSCHQAGNQQVTAATASRIKRLAKAYLAYADLQDKSWRYDRIELLVISEDRALLRHHRDVLNSVN